MSFLMGLTFVQWLIITGLFAIIFILIVKLQHRVEQDTYVSRATRDQIRKDYPDG
jgi:hypothetical protein